MFTAVQFRDSRFEKKRANKKQAAKREQENREERLFCAWCGHPVTTQAMAISVAGSHTHTFTNPAGFIYTVHCFSSASGCTAVGKPTSEHSWFSGYQWQLALCAACQNHLGWVFTNGSSFYGLIEGRLTGSP